MTGPKTPIRRGSSPPSPAATVLDCRPSLIRRGWWVLLVAWLGIAMALSALPAYVKIAALAGLVMAAWRDARQAAPALAMTADGRFSLPGQELFGLEAGPRTRTSRWWVHLDLVGPQGRCRLLLLADQLEPGAWRALRLQLKERRHEPRNGRRSRP